MTILVSPTLVMAASPFGNNSNSNHTNYTNASALPPMASLALEATPRSRVPAPDNGSRVVCGDFVLLNEIGSGSFAKVCSAKRSSDDNVEYVVKMIKRPQPDHTYKPDRFVPKPELEVLCMRKVQNHPNIVRLHQVGYSNNHCYMIQEYLRGGDLFDEVISVWKTNGATSRQGGLDERTAARYFAQLLGAVGHMHANGVAHRDIKAENVFLSQDKARAALGDFGFATCSSVCKSRCGTLDYIAPEVLESNTSDPAFVGFDPKAVDVWACAVVLFVMLTARLPFDSSSKTQIIANIKARKFEFPHNMVPTDAQDLILSIFLADPDTRPTVHQLRKHPFLRRHKARVEPPVVNSAAGTPGAALPSGV